MSTSFNVYETQYVARCTECDTEITEAYIVEMMDIRACSKACLKKKISYEEFLKRHDGGKGDAYWTDELEGAE